MVLGNMGGGRCEAGSGRREHKVYALLHVGTTPNPFLRWGNESRYRIEVTGGVVASRYILTLRQIESTGRVGRRCWRCENDFVVDF